MGRATSTYGEYIERLAAIVARFADALAGSRTIRASGTASREVARVLAPLPDLAAAGRSTWAVQRAVSWQIDVVLTVVRVVVLAVAGVGVADGRITPGEVLAASVYLTFALGFLNQVDALMRLSEARASAARVFEVMAERPATTPAGDLPPRSTGPALSFRGVCVRLDEQTVLDSVNLDVPRGAAVAVVGRSGAGKTTLALLAGRLIDPDRGEVLVHGVPVRRLAVDVLRREVSYAFDRPVLAGRTIRDGLTYGRPDATRDRVARATGIAYADDFLRRLPDGLDTPLAGAPLSGGELQRLGLARAIVHAGGVMVLDDATSSLDTVTEARVTEALTAGLAGTTRLVIAHRAATAAAADLVAWLEAGRIRALAPHHALWDSEPAYREIFAVDRSEEDSE
jgi:ATP-binding cassette subfamily B protein